MPLNKLTSTRARWLAALLGAYALTNVAGSAWAGEARIAEEAGPNHVVVEARDATLDEILALLATRFGFAVERVTQATSTNRLSGRLQGSLDRLLERVLRDQGYMIVRSDEAKAGISKVIVLDSKGRAPVAATATGGAGPGKAQAPVQAPSVPSTPEPPAKPLGQNISNQLPAASDGTLRQLEEIGRQMMGMDPSRSIDARSHPSAGESATAALPSAGGTGSVDSDVQQLTQRAVANVQSLANSLRAACLGPSCRR